MKKLILLVLIASFFNLNITAQDGGMVDYTKPQEYEIGGIKIEGTKFLDKDVLISISGLRVGETIGIPSDITAKAIKNLWDQKLFTDVNIAIERKIGSTVFLVIKVDELPRLSRYSIEGASKGQVEDLRKQVNLRSGSIFTESDRLNTITRIKDYYIDKGFYGVKVEITEVADEISQNSVIVNIDIDKGKKVRINQIVINGNDNQKGSKLKGQMKDTKIKVKFELAEMLNYQKNKINDRSLFGMISNINYQGFLDYAEGHVNLNIFKISKFDEDAYKADKKKVIAFYNAKGYRDAKIVQDDVYFDENGEANISILIEEGNLYYFRNIEWTGNSIYSDTVLSKIVNIQKGDIYSQGTLDQKLFMNPQGGDVSSLYMDDGYLFFNVTPVEKRIQNDSVDLLMKIYEGPQATINEVRIVGNTKTNEKVIRREIRIMPGNKFSRSDLIRSQRELANLGYFDPEQLEVIPIPNPETGTVDIEFRVVEKPSDQLELSAGWGGVGTGIVGTLGVQFTNFSLKNIFRPKYWSPLPSGDGQNFTVRVQSNGKQSQNYNFSFTEPWLGGKKPIAFTSSFFVQQLNTLTEITKGKIDGSLLTIGATLAVGTRLKWPDNFFTLRTALNLQNYNLNNFVGLGNNFIFSDGAATNVNLSATLARNSIDNPLFPKRGSNVSFTFTTTLPYSKIFNKRKETLASPELTPEKKFNWIEYHKYNFSAEWYTPIVGNLIFKASAKLGFLGSFNKDIGITPFERFELGGDAFQQVTYLGRQPFGLRGYDNLTDVNGNIGFPIFNKFSMELRYPISLNPSATVYVLGFVEGGNVYSSFNEYKPYDLKKSYGAGLRLYLPMFGLLGFDYGIGFDNGNTVGNNIFEKYGKFRIILGFEPE
ncbi:MAG: BamA/OMP85 family outer membrane protein [Chitinophagales bacterium]